MFDTLSDKLQVALGDPRGRGVLREEDLSRAMRKIRWRCSTPTSQVAMRHARALIADDAEAEAFFQAGLEAGLSRWPFRALAAGLRSVASP
jgi:hypothetical protein